ncbi:YiiD C-terminal domain-containing protein [Halomonas sabkhae]|uniref:YiiD C-terminal domain-containing protein n=1 Tax=Halomonas sabkhae TaxID=626223 RepID=UPI0025B4C728|nr:YiiD C-terminal domain-containing protein [Halomonas sabkhae]MDN3525439.1 YiiD C-terminal domain-containing protein [Halomonas sabkhae]
MIERGVGEAHPRLPLPASGQEDDPLAFLAWLHDAIPLAGQLGIRDMHRQGDSLTWQLALTPNLNDKGTGFGGSLTAQTTLLGWCWVTLWLRRQGIERDVVVAESRQRFLAPVTGDYRLTCTPEDEQGRATLAASLQKGGKGRIALVQQLWCGDTLCLEARDDYAVLPEKPA